MNAQQVADARARRVAVATAMYRDGATLTEIAREIAGSRATVSRWMNNIPGLSRRATRSYLPGVSASERFWTHVKRGADDECWTWRRSLSSRGYGQMWRGNESTPAHRFAYELLIGPIPTGLVIDHLCCNRACVNPSHLEPVTSAENVARAPNAPAKRTHCPKGHEYTEANTRRQQRRNRAPARECRECHRQSNKPRRPEQTL